MREEETLKMKIESLKKETREQDKIIQKLLKQVEEEQKELEQIEKRLLKKDAK